MTKTEYLLTLLFGACIVTATMVASVVTVVDVAETVDLPRLLVQSLPWALEPLAALAGWRWLRHSDRAAMWWALTAFAAAVAINMAAASTVAGALLHAIFPAAVIGALHMIMHATAQLADDRATVRARVADENARAHRERARADFEQAQARAQHELAAHPRAQAMRTTTRTTTTETRTDVLELVRGDDARPLVAAWIEQGNDLRAPALTKHLAGELDISESQARRKLAEARAAVKGGP